MHQIIKFSKIFLQPFSYSLDLSVIVHIARVKRRSAGQSRGELLHIFFKTIALISERELATVVGKRLRNSPRDATLIGNAANKTLFTF